MTSATRSASRVATIGAAPHPAPGKANDEKAETAGRREVNRESRRSPRIALAHPLRIRFAGSDVYAESVTVNAHGALVDSPVPIVLGTNLFVLNQRTGESSRAWVVFARNGERPGRHAVGIEFLPPAPGFWGTAYRP